MNNIMQISLDQIDLTDETRLRESDSLELVEEYAVTLRQHMKKRKLTQYPFPPGSAYKRADGKHVLTAGRHRGLAAKKVGLKEIPCVIYSDEGEAVWAGLGDNRKNGLRNSPGDLKKMITTALQKYKELSNREIAKHIGCSASSVDQVARELRKNTQESNQPAKEGEVADEQNQQKPEEKPVDEAPNTDPPVTETPGDAGPPGSDIDEQVSEDRVEALLAQVRKSYEDFSEDERAFFEDKLYQFLCDIDYLESEVGSAENDTESDDEIESEAEVNADGGDGNDDDVFDQSDMLKVNDEETAED